MIRQRFRSESDLPEQFFPFGLFDRTGIIHHYCFVKKKFQQVSLNFTMVLKVKDNDSVNLGGKHG